MHFIYNSTVAEFKLGRSCVLHKHFTLLFFCLKFVGNITWFCCISHKVYTVCGKLTINMCVPSYSYILVVWENNISAFHLLHEYKKSLTKPEKIGKETLMMTSLISILWNNVQEPPFSSLVPTVVTVFWQQCASCSDCPCCFWFTFSWLLTMSSLFMYPLGI